MREYGSVHTRFWISSDVLQLSDKAKLLALYLLTGPHTNMLGCFRLPIGYVAEDLGWSNKTVSKGFSELLESGFATHDKASGWVLIHRFLDWNPIENPNQGKSIEKLFDQVSHNISIYNDLIDIVSQNSEYLTEPFQNRLETLSKRFRNQEQEQNQKQDICAEQILNPNSCEANLEVISIPLSNKTEFPLFQNQIDEWKTLYPAVDILQTLRNIRGWNLSNPTKRKTRSGILRHITQWLAKEQNQSFHSVHSPPRNFSAQPLHDFNTAIGEMWLNATEQSSQPCQLSTSLSISGDN